MKVLVIGSLNMDYTLYVHNFPRDGETIDGLSKLKHAGGKGANQAVALARAGVDVDFVGAIGKDQDGMELKSLLENEHINLYLQESNLETGSATIIVNDKAENKIIIIHGANYAIDKSTIDSRIDVIKEADYILLQNEISSDINDYIISLADKFGKKIVYNPAPYRDIDDTILSKISYITPNETELNSLIKDVQLSFEEKVDLLLKKGVKNVIVTLGTKGSYYASNIDKGYVPAFKVEAVDTVAAGDTFNGYFIAGLSRDLSLKDALIYASKASALSVRKKGAISSIPYHQEVNTIKL